MRRNDANSLNEWCNHSIVWYNHSIMNPLADLFSSRVRAAILRLLFGPAEAELHVREIERRSGLSVGTVRQDLRTLVRLTLVVSRRDGNRLYYSANRDHPLYLDIRRIVLKTSGLADVIRARLGAEGVKIAFVFGSVAEGREKSGSDVDLLVVGKVGLREVTARLAGASDEIGREINPYVVSVAEFRRRVQAEDHFLTRIRKAPRIFIVGDDDDLAAMG